MIMEWKPSNWFNLPSLDVPVNLSTSTTVLLVIILVVSIIYLRKHLYQNFPPGPWGVPIIGNLKLLQEKPHLHLTYLQKKYGDVFSLRLGKYRTVVVCSVEGIQEGLVKNSHKFSGRSAIFSNRILFNGHPDGGICFSDMNIKCKMKKDFLLQGLDQLCCGHTGLEDLLSAQALQLTYSLLDSDRPCDIAAMMESLTLRIMLYLVNGKLYDGDDENFLEIWRTFNMRFQTCCENWSQFVPFVKRFQSHKNLGVWERTNLHIEYQRSIINRHKDCYNPTIVSDLIDHMLIILETNEDMGLLDHEDLDHLFIEVSGCGYKAVSCTLMWLLLYVTTYPEIQAKVQEELLTVVGKDRLPKLTDQPYLPYTCAVVMETHRMASVFPFLIPHTVREATEFQGYLLPKDTMVLFNVWSLHHDPRYWKHPMKFDPTRFLMPDRTLHIPDHFLPFGEGLRACPGESLADMELFIFFTHLLHQLNLKLVSDVSLEGDYKGYIITPKPFSIVASPREVIENETDFETKVSETNLVTPEFCLVVDGPDTDA